jgi:regulator of cell morphogenesis and NO signaling
MDVTTGVGASGGLPTMSEIYRETAIGDLVARDLRTATVFSRYGIDFCCGGRRTIEDACVGAHLDPDRVVADLRAVAEAASTERDVSGWPAGRLIDRIVTRHHTYVRAQTPVIAAYLAKLLAKHGERHPELGRLAAIFADVSDEFARHMAREEQVLFPAIARLAGAHAGGWKMGGASGPLDHQLEQPLRRMEDDHEWAGRQLALMRTLANGYEVPKGGCVTWKACYVALDDFENDLHQHVHLENNVLFPLARRLSEPAVTG